jgi:hypothetical protein
MAAIVSSNFRTLNAKNFIEDVRTTGNNVYIGIGKSSAWTTTTANVVDGTVPLPQDDLDDINVARKQLLGIKLIGNDDISHVCPRHNWVSGTTYVAWDSDDPDIFEKVFYVLTADFKVYKCLFSPGTASNDVPTSTAAAPFSTSDNYVWKYMYTILAADAEKFLTTSYMPVRTLPESVTVTVPATQSAATTTTISEANPELVVGMTATAASNGTLDSTPKITAINGTIITTDSTIATGTTNTTVTFSDFESTDSKFAQQQSQKDSRALTNAQGIERIVITAAGSGYPDDGSSITLTIKGDGINAAISTADALTDDTNDNFITTPLTAHIPSNKGQDYTVASVIIEHATGTGATARAVIAPGAGHGTDPVTELGGFYVAINSQISGATDATDIVNTQDFRQIMLLKNPLNGGARISSSTARATKKLLMAPESEHDGTDVKLAVVNTSSLSNDPVMVGNTSKTVAYVTAVDTTASTPAIFYHQNEVTGFGDFTNNETLDISVAGTLIADDIHVKAASATEDPEFDTGTGDILFLENRDPILRSSTQVEDVKLIIEF